jgi:3-dehydrosphinganine reductase
MKIKAQIGMGKVALITGGSSGIGFAFARQLVQSGTDIWILARRTEVLEQAVRALSNVISVDGQKVGGIPADVVNWDQIQEIARSDTFLGKPPDLLINSAGVVRPGYIQALEIEYFRWMMDINYYGTLHMIKAFIPAMMERQSGYIINIASGGGLTGIFGYTGYCASKFAVKGFSDSLRYELHPYGIGVSVVYPSDTDTPQLAYEMQFKPPETVALTSAVGKMTAKEVAKQIIKSASKGHAVILPGIEAKLAYLLSTNLGGMGIDLISKIILKRVAKEFKKGKELA